MNWKKEQKKGMRRVYHTPGKCATTPCPACVEILKQRKPEPRQTLFE